MLLLVVLKRICDFLFIYLEKHIKSGWFLARKKSRKLRHFFIWKRLGRSLNHYHSWEGLAGELRGKENVSWNFTLSSCAGEFFSIQWNQRENIYIWQNIIWPQSTSPFSILLKPLISLSAPDRRWFTRVWQWLLFLSDWRAHAIVNKTKSAPKCKVSIKLSRNLISLFFDIELEQEWNISIEWRQQSSNVWQTFSIFLLQGATCC